MIKSLSLENFRSHARLQLDLAPLTMIHGPNGAGKTNILEALWMLATTRSFRAVRDSQVVRWEADAARVIGDDYELVVVRAPMPTKLMRIRGVDRSSIDYLGELRAVLFTPDSFRILLGSPEERRRFLDTILAQKDRTVARSLLTYRRILRQRNYLLDAIARGVASGSELIPWDEQLVATGVAITRARRQLATQLVTSFTHHYRLLGPSRVRDVNLTYEPAASEEPTRYHDQLVKLRTREIALGVSLVGPHRDDVVVTLAGRRAAEHASRGELRRILLALKWAEMEVLSEGGNSVVMLLDDIFSEFDLAARAAVFSLPRKVQTVITTTDLSVTTDSLPKDAVAIHLPAGSIQ